MPIGVNQVVLGLTWLFSGKLLLEIQCCLQEDGF